MIICDFEATFQSKGGAEAERNAIKAYLFTAYDTILSDQSIFTGGSVMRLRLLLIPICIACLLLPFKSVQAQTDQPEFRPGVIIVGYRETVTPRLFALPEGAKASAESPQLEPLNVVVVEVPVGEEVAFIKKLASEPGVAFAELDYAVHAELEPDDPRWPEQYGPVSIRAPQAWDLTTGSASTIIAILDSGMDTSHPEFTGRLVSGYDFIQNDGTPQDLCGHGTHVAGIAAGNANNQGIAGIDWQARIMPVRVLNGSCSGFVSGVADGILWAVENGADIINMSLGTSAPSSLLENATYYAYSRGVTLIAAAGNFGASLSYPARYPWVMAVGAVDRSNVVGNFSNPSTDPNKMMVTAPGVDVLSSTPRSAFYYENALGWTRNYSQGTGTSMAAPHVAGAAGLLASQAAFDTPDKIYQALYSTTLDLGTPGWDAEYGYGLIQLDQALAFEDFDPPQPEPDIPVEYDMVTSLDCANIVYGWLDAEAGGTPLPVFGTDGWAEVTLPFSFDFAGQSYTTMYVSANGYITFIRPTGFSTVRENSFIPGIALPNEMIAPFWDDHNPSAGGQVYGMDLGDRYVVEWNQVPHQGFTSPESMATFEVVLFRSSNRILFQYHTLRGEFSNGSSATVGLEYAQGRAGDAYSYNRPNALREELAILFVPVMPGSTRVTASCLFTSRTVFRGCSQMPPFGVDLFIDPQPQQPDPIELSIRLLRAFRPLPGLWLSLDQFADITLDNAPNPITPLPIVCYQYSSQDVLKAGGHADNMFIASFNTSTGRWERLPTAVDPQQRLLMAPASHFSTFGIFARQPEALPVTGARLRAADLFVVVSLLIFAGLGLAKLVRRR